MLWPCILASATKNWKKKFQEWLPFRFLSEMQKNHIREGRTAPPPPGLMNIWPVKNIANYVSKAELFGELPNLTS